MRVLIVTGDFAGAQRNPWLLDDLASAMAELGDQVDVLIHDTKHGRPHGGQAHPSSRIRPFSVGPKKVHGGIGGKLIAHFSAAWGLHTRGYRFASDSEYDLCIYTSIGLFSWGLPARVRRRQIARCSIFLMWDFFPIHHLEIGRIRFPWLHRPLRFLERLTLRNADAVGVMSPKNEGFFRKYHSTLAARTVIVPPWASVPNGSPWTEVRSKAETFTVVFGGQLTAGRGVDTLLAAARRLQDAHAPIAMRVIGDGPARQALMDHASALGLENTTFTRMLSRTEYRKILAAAHVGVAITVPGVSPPTFPSKIVEYCASALPVVVCVEPASDAGAIIERAGAGLAVAAGDDERLASALSQLYEEHQAGLLSARAKHARALFDAEMSVRRAAERIRRVGAA